MTLVSNNYTRKLAPLKLRPRLNGPGKPLPEPKRIGDWNNLVNDIVRLDQALRAMGKHNTPIEIYPYQARALTRYRVQCLQRERALDTALLGRKLITVIWEG